MAKNCGGVLENILKIAGRTAIDTKTLKMSFQVKDLRSKGFSTSEISDMRKYLSDNSSLVQSWVKAQPNMISNTKYTFTFLSENYKTGSHKGKNRNTFRQSGKFLKEALGNMPHLWSGDNSKNLDTGHSRSSSAGLFGIVSAVDSLGVYEDVDEATGIKEATRPELKKILQNNEILNELTKLLGDPDNIYLEVDKLIDATYENAISGKPLATVTLERISDNRLVGRTLEKAIGKGATKFYLDEYADKVENAARNDPKLVKSILECLSSPSLEGNVASLVINTILDVKSTNKRKKIRSKNKKSNIKGKVTSVKAPTISKKEVQKTIGKSYVSMQLLMNKVIEDTLRNNMGKGRATKKLNYRTGRFAKNVRVDAVIPTRNSSITAFYSYMKNPYSTFAEGGAQYRNEPARDPNLLIKKSLRQIAIGALAIPRFFPMES